MVNQKRFWRDVVKRGRRSSATSAILTAAPIAGLQRSLSNENKMDTCGHILTEAGNFLDTESSNRLVTECFVPPTPLMAPGSAAVGGIWTVFSSNDQDNPLTTSTLNQRTLIEVVAQFKAIKGDGERFDQFVELGLMLFQNWKEQPGN